jgi:hypothetical protein
MKCTHGEGVLVLALFAALVSCADPAGRTVGPNSSKDIAADPSPGAVGEERAALTRIARLIAQAMDNEPARQRLKRDMRAAPFKEHKLELGSYLRSKDGRALLDAMVAKSGGGEAEVFGPLAAIRPLEFYMPVAKHRESWTGRGDVLVVSQLDESEPIVAFDQGGRGVTLDKKVPPDQPTLSIVPVETRFDQPMLPAASRNVRDEGGNAIGTLEPLAIKGSNLISCGETCDGGGGGSTTPALPPGLYLEFSRILDLKEPWTRGDPEIEVHIQGPDAAVGPTYVGDQSCSGEHVYDSRKYFDQNTGFWDGHVMLFSEEETVAYLNRFNQGFHILFWEDDNTSCVLKLDSNSLVQLLQSSASAAGTVALKVIPGTSWALVATAFVGSLFANAGAWLLTNDDFVGAAVAMEGSGYSYPGNTHVIMDGTTLNGRATIIYHH